MHSRNAISTYFRTMVGSFEIKLRVDSGEGNYSNFGTQIEGGLEEKKRKATDMWVGLGLP